MKPTAALLLLSAGTAAATGRDVLLFTLYSNHSLMWAELDGSGGTVVAAQRIPSHLAAFFAIFHPKTGVIGGFGAEKSGHFM